MAKLNSLITKIDNLKKSDLRNKIRSRIHEFKSLGEFASDKELFSELCFCIMTANFNAEKAIKIQTELKEHFSKLPEKKLAERLKQLGHRYPNTRANYISHSQQHSLTLSKKLDELDEFALREWLVKNIKGLGMKEASHFMRNIGYESVAIIDFHIVDILVEHGLIKKPKNKSMSKKQYLEIEEILRSLGQKTSLTLAELDIYLWYVETGKVLK